MTTKLKTFFLSLFTVRKTGRFMMAVLLGGASIAQAAVSNENFDSTPLINANTTSVTSGDWTFATNVTTIFQSPNSTELATNLNAGTDRSLRFNAGGVNVAAFTIRTTDGSDFDLASMAINDILETDFSIEGFRDGVSVVAAEFVDSATSDTAGNIHYTFAATTGDGSHGSLAFQSAYDNVDEIRITSAAALSQFDIDDIVASAALTNTAPELGGTPADDTATEDIATAIDLSAYNISDADGDTITLTLGVDRGTIASTDGNGTTAGVTVANTGSASMTLQGSVANLNTYLNDTSKITYTTASNDTTTAVLTVTPNDGTVNGTADTVNISITPANDDPTGSSVPSDITVTEDTQSNVNLSAMSFADIDSASITVNLTASAGTFASPADGAGVGSGVTETLQSATVIALAGSPADINTYLDTATNIQYTAASNVNGDNAATITVTANDGDGSGDVGVGTVNIDVTAVNDVPVFTNLDGTPTFTEGGSAQVLDANVTVADLELDALNGGAGNFNGAVLTLARNGGANTNDVFSAAGTLSAFTEGVNFSVGGSVVGTVTTNSGGTLVLTFSDASVTPSTALVNSALQQIAYANSSNDPAASVQINWNFSDGNSGNAQGTGDNPGTSTGATTVSVTNVNDAPTLTATGGNPTYTENGGAQDLFNTVTASTVEAADRFTSLSLTVTNVNDGASEILSFDGSDVALTNGNAINTATNGLSVSVSVTGTTATVSFTSATLTNAQMQTLIDALTYRNSSAVPTTAGNRVVTITGITDNGGTTNSGSDSTAPNLTSTVTVSAVNDEPTLSDFGPNAGNVSYTAGSTTFVAFDSGTVANLQDTELDTLNTGAGNYNGATVTLVRNGGVDITDRFGMAGGTTVLDNGSTVTVAATNIGTVTAGSAATGTITITFNSSATSALVDTFFQSIGYTNSNGAATGTVTIDVTFNDGNTGAQGAGGAESVTQQVNVTIGNPPVIGNLTGDTAAFTENGGAVIMDQGGDATVTDADLPANLNGGNLSISVTANANAAQDVLSFSTAGTVALSGTAAGSNVSVGGLAIGTLANSIAAGNTLQVNLNTNATTANVQTLLQAVTYDNTSEAPTTSDRTVSFVVTDDSGLSSTAVTATVTVAAVNDDPALTNLDGDSFSYNPGDGAQVLDQGTGTGLADIDSSDFDGGNLTVTITSGEDASEDTLSFNTGGTVALAGTTAGSDVSVGGTVIGTLGNSIAVGSDLVVNFNTIEATLARIGTLLQAITYENTDTLATTTGARNVRVTVNDGDGGTSPNNDVTITIPDGDNDNVSNGIENGAPNGGDNNGDGNADSTQPHVSSFFNGVITADYNSLEIENEATCPTITNIVSQQESGLASADASFDYPVGLWDFTIDCGGAAGIGSTANIKIILNQVHADAATWTFRKFNPTTNFYADVAGVTTQTENLGGRNVTTITYSVTDGGPLDFDPLPGIIRDPFGAGAPAATVAGGGGGAPTVGQNTGVLNLCDLNTRKNINTYPNDANGEAFTNFRSCQQEKGVFDESCVDNWITAMNYSRDTNCNVAESAVPATAPVVAETAVVPEESATADLFTDVPEDHRYGEAIAYLKETGMVQGYDDGTFKPDQVLTRVEFLKIVLEAAGNNSQTCKRDFGYSDVSWQSWYGDYVQRASCLEVIQGYPDGTLRPGNGINFVEAAKVAIMALGIEVDLKSEVWFRSYVDYLEANQAVPPTIRSNNQTLTRGEMAYIIWKLSQ